MSPEQAKGRTVDKRSDIWAFGCVLYEMLTGRPAFGGGGVTEVLARVLERDPDWSALPHGLPPSIRRLLRRGLEKERRRRLSDIADARLEIDEALSGRESDAPAVQPAAARRISILAAALILAFGLAIAGASAARLAARRRAEALRKRGSRGAAARHDVGALAGRFYHAAGAVPRRPAPGLHRRSEAWRTPDLDSRARFDSSAAAPGH
jgi:hypothetical protein